MTRGEGITRLAQEHGLPVITIGELIAYRLKEEARVH
jgi:3,4-dihydroxy-2-butanone 4-phosphate synthase